MESVSSITVTLYVSCFLSFGESLELQLLLASNLLTAVSFT